MTQSTPIPQSEPATHIVSLEGETRRVNAATYQEACDELHAKYGGVPKVTRISELVRDAIPIGKVKPHAPSVALVKPPVDDLDGDGVSASGRERGERDAQIASENGFVLAEPVYRLGTRVNSIGVENAHASQVEHDAKPFAQELASSLVAHVRAEDRQDLPVVRLADLRMTSSGKLALPDSHQVLQGARMPINERIFAGLMQRMPCASGTAYLNDCPTQLRSINFNHWAVALGESERGAGDHVKEVVVRTRKVGATRVAYGAVSPKYTSFDADKIGEALQMAFPSDARGSLDYDGERFRLEGMWHSDVPAADYVAGEVFKAGVIVTSGDVGGHAIRVQSTIWRNLCLNLIILSKAIGVDVRLRHQGSVQALAASFRDAFNQALTSVDAFRRAWTYARNEQGRELIKAVQGTTRDDLASLPVEAVLPGIFNGILERDLVPVRGRREDAVPKLLEMHRADEAAEEYGVSRASVVNAFTRYAHEVETDPFRADDIRAGAGALLSSHHGKAPAPLPYLAMA
jgi:hypothetical protein